ncbi:MAG: nucleotidyltransferase family protein [Deltaproteobacteria bacterium]|nr:nucleotidyltransferase family protein [Deltaproteobacteria bacterium]
MIAILLCAGYATRMYPLTRNYPKPLLSVAGKPVIDYFMEQLMELDELRSVHVVTNHKFTPFFEKWQRRWLDKNPGAPFGVEIHNDGSTEDENKLGASVDLAWVLNRLPKASRMLVAAGDNIFRFRIKPLWSQFLKSHTHWIIALEETNPVKLMQSGVLEFSKNDRVIRLHEKPQSPPSTWCCPAIYFFKHSAVSILNEFLKVSEQTDAPGHFIDYLCQKQCIRAFRLKAFRFDIGSIEDYRKADRLLRQETLFQN